ncbi:hypothetical protein C8A01DRAFT_41280 [Parachaetomium inaequale]|uniref:Uncharacterized protein n=1 Tax=Parachaetomium inaequale TaxID=2588326 RepID=A0AAN6P7P8_9PEZI|nr:hypothetical protein C8A01DRAFT_41280 [Parachaetomium inaequale]
MSVRDFYVRLQVPPVTPTTFCQPVALGGPGGRGLEPAAWPILMPAKDGFQVCYTLDKKFRDTYLDRGFCGLDASFRDQFDHKCPEQVIHVAPTVREQGTGVCRDDDDRQERSIFDSGWNGLKNMLCRVRSYFERLNDGIESVWAVLFYFFFVTIPTASLASFTALVLICLFAQFLEVLGLVSFAPHQDTAVDLEKADKTSKSSASEKTSATPATRTTTHAATRTTTPAATRTTTHAASSTNTQRPSAEPIKRPAPPSDDDSYELVQHESKKSVADIIAGTPSTTSTRRVRRGRRDPLLSYPYREGRDLEQINDGYVDVGRATPSSSQESFGFNSCW